MQVAPFGEFLGMEVVSKEDGTAVIALTLAEHHCNRRGVAHGGVITALLDSALGGAVISAMPPEWWCATTSLSTQFLQGGRSGRLIATGRVVRRGVSIAFATGEVRDEAGRLLATAHGSWHVWPQHPGRKKRTGGPRVRLRGGERSLRVGKILAVGRNYAAHNVEMGAAAVAAPLLFLKPPSALVQDGAEIQLPADAGEVHHEVELVAVIGKTGKGIQEESALQHVAGFAVGLDLTLRDLQSDAKKRGEPWSLSKGFDGSAPVSDVAPRDEVGDGSGLAIRLEVNGELRQSGSTSQMQRSVAALVAFASRYITLDRGDLLFTGTPSGVGPVRPGDRLTATLEKVGSVHVRARS